MRSLCLLALIALAAWADDTVIVTGHGEAKVRPDRVEFRFAVSARAEKAADAVTKIGEKSAKVRDDLKAAAAARKLEGATVKESGLDFRSPPGNEDAMVVMGGAGGGGEGGGEVMVEKTVTMTVDGIDKLKDGEVAEHVAAIVDAAVAAGANYSGGMQWDWTGRGPVPATVVFRMSDPQAALAKAWDAAAEDAKKRAAEIAKRFGRQIGDVSKVEDVSGPLSGTAEAQPLAPGQAGSHQSTFSGTGEATITAELKVEFKLK
ncbi:MAG: SIMPL domain-containing protein [Planctomycetota bacterium]